jgi:hypothetical protein
MFYDISTLPLFFIRLLTKYTPPAILAPIDDVPPNVINTTDQIGKLLLLVFELYEFSLLYVSCGYLLFDFVSLFNFVLLSDEYSLIDFCLDDPHGKLVFSDLSFALFDSELDSESIMDECFSLELSESELGV